MPYADPLKQRAAVRESKRRSRAAGSGGQTKRRTLPSLADLRLDSARDVLRVLGEELEAVRREQAEGSTERARTVSLLCSGLLRAFEQVDVLSRIETLEQRLDTGMEVLQ